MRRTTDRGVVNLLLGNGDGSFRAPAQSHASQYPFSVASAYVDNDHKLDLALRSHIVPPPGCREFCISGDTTNLYRGNGDGTFDSGIRLAFRIGSVGGNIAAGDFNADSKLDLFLARPNGPQHGPPGLLFLGSGDGSFVQVPFDSSGLGGFVAAVDFNGDNL